MEPKIHCSVALSGYTMEFYPQTQRWNNSVHVSEQFQFLGNYPPTPPITQH